MPLDNRYTPYAESTYNLGITSGCGSGNYCPATSVKRGQMAVFLLRAKYASYFPPH